MCPYPKPTLNPGSPFLVPPVAVPSDSVPYCCLAKFLCIRDRRDSVPKKEKYVPLASHLRSPAQVASLRCAPLPEVSTPRPQLKSSRPDKSLRLIITGASNPILPHPVSASHVSQLPAIINQQKHYPYMDRHCRCGLLEQRIETNFQVVSILIG